MGWSILKRERSEETGSRILLPPALLPDPCVSYLMPVLRHEMSHLRRESSRSQLPVISFLGEFGLMSSGGFSAPNLRISSLSLFFKKKKKKTLLAMLVPYHIYCSHLLMRNGNFYLMGGNLRLRTYMINRCIRLQPCSFCCCWGSANSFLN